MNQDIFSVHRCSTEAGKHAKDVALSCLLVASSHWEGSALLGSQVFTTNLTLSVFWCMLRCGVNETHKIINT